MLINLFMPSIKRFFFIIRQQYGNTRSQRETPDKYRDFNVCWRPLPSIKYIFVKHFRHISTINLHWQVFMLTSKLIEIESFPQMQVWRILCLFLIYIFHFIEALNILSLVIKLYTIEPTNECAACYRWKSRQK